MRTFAVLTLILIAANVFASDKLYRYVDPNGVVHFTDQPPTKGAKPLVLDGSRPDVAKKKWNDAASVDIIRSATRFAVHWTLPSPGQVYRETSPDLLVVISVMPGLAQGFGINFYVDGNLQNKRPIPDIQTTLHGIGAGRHQLSAALISKDGRELARSVPLNFEIKSVLAKK